MSDTLSGRNLVQVGLATCDLPRAVAFYRDVLGLPLLFEVSGMAFFQLGATRLMVGSNAEHLTPNADGALYFDAPDLPVLAEALERKGVRFLRPAETVQRTDNGDLMIRFFHDPDGNLLALMGMVARG
jgi:catechol 2,3-dioxygenase-like lactoylglutathione lyase family enzyme